MKDIPIATTDLEAIYELAANIATETRGTYHTVTRLNATGSHRGIFDAHEYMQANAEAILTILEQYTEQ
ncbi:hypothetical protein [Lacticaseibacillus paracasei]|uniref:Uncharacterized protein n=1 Tax=Lacticaseibacillus paracasei subsp. paracasei Lpp126 TaxID=1256206 RepID=S2R0S3_LACPA|nr:hypothetical protein Lpp126_16279 [Lacticaseibacillus paracasei subsp. paracasei Lpp126]